MTYSQASDLLTGDIPLASRYGNGSGFVATAADEIDAQIGHIYTTPVVMADTPENRPAVLLLKKINNFLASGRLILDMAAGQEDRDLHRYGQSLIDEALALLRQVQDGKIILPAEKLVDGGPEEYSGPSITQEDPESLVEGFYQQFSHGEIRGPFAPLAPYSPRINPALPVETP